MSVIALAGCVPGPAACSGYDELVFHDEFDGDALGGIWATAPFGGSLPATVDDGVMTIRTTAANDYRWGYVASTGPRLDIEPSYPFARSWQEGYFEARLRYTDSPWTWPAFWLFSMSKSEAWPREDCRLLNSEWDVMENGMSGPEPEPPSHSTSSVLHRNTTDNTEDGYCGIPDETRKLHSDIADINLAEWHTWAGLWTADQLCTFVDQRPLGCVDPYDSTAQPMHIVFTVQYVGECGGCPRRPDSLEMQVDWVRVWR